MYAALPMYDFPINRKETDHFWSVLSQYLADQGLRDIPRNLEHDINSICAIEKPDLIFGQICGYSLMHNMRDDMIYIATPHYNFNGCRGFNYSSFFITRKNDPRRSLTEFQNATFGYSEDDSHSGNNILHYHLFKSGLDLSTLFFKKTGSHVNSCNMLANGDIDMAAVDCVSWHWILKQYPQMSDKIAVISQSDPAPGLPFVMSREFADDYLAPLQSALMNAFKDPDILRAAQPIGIYDISILDPQAYEIIAQMRKAYRGG